MKSTNMFNSSKEIVLAILVGIAALVFSIRLFISRKDLSQTGVYVLGIVTEVTFNKSGRTYSYEYLYNKGKYKGAEKSIGLGLHTGDLVLIQILPDHPETNVLISDQSVPKSYSLDSVPVNGWSKKPF